MVFFVAPDENLDLAGLSFQVPICGFAAKQAAPARKQTARVNRIVFVFMGAMESRFLVRVNAFSDINPARRNLPRGPAMVVRDPRQDEIV
jgi:hypothetical protein